MVKGMKCLKMAVLIAEKCFEAIEYLAMLEQGQENSSKVYLKEPP
jgi:hypothetical protein